MKEKRYDEALAHFETSIKYHDDNALTDYCIAQLHIRRNQPILAIERFEKIMQGHGIGFGGFNTFMLYIDYGYAMVNVQQWDLAINLLKQGLKMNADVPYAWNALGFVYAQKQMWKEAAESFTEGLGWDPENPFIWNNMAAIYIIAENYEGARQVLVKVLTKHPEYEFAQHNGQILHSIVQNEAATFPVVDLFYDSML